MLNQVKRRFTGAVTFVRAARSALNQNGDAIRHANGKTRTQQFFEMAALNFGKGCVSPDEYYDFKLYETRSFGDSVSRRKFFGKAMERRLARAFDSAGWSAIANDKLITYALLQSWGFPIPKVIGVVHRFRKYGEVPTCWGLESMPAFFASLGDSPFVIKPITGMYSRDVIAVEKVDEPAKRFNTSDGNTLSFSEFAQIAEVHGEDGMVIQQLIRPNAKLADIGIQRISSVRMIVLVSDAGPQLFRAVWKIACGDNIADNYWRPGNMMAHLDVATGRVLRVVSGRGRNMKEIAEHPSTKHSFKDFQLPDWDAAVTMCLTAAASLPGLRMQAWDVALTDQGPALLEVNIIGGLDLPQLALGEGIYEGHFQRFVDQYARL